MLGTTPVTRYLLQSLLQAVPPFTPLEPYRDSNLNNWRRGGAYRLMTSNKRGFTLAVNNIREYSAALFADSQHLINHVMEHRAHLMNALSTGRETSPTWIFVTVYYMALFSAMAWTRAANSAVVYLDTEAIIEFCGKNSTRPGGGAFLISTTTDPLTNQSEVRITKSNHSHFHEAVWVESMDGIGKAFHWIAGQANSRSSSADELLHMRALNLFLKTKFQTGPVWPSKLRNALNYRPGFSYRSVVRNNMLKLNSRLTKKPFEDFASLVGYGEHVQNNLGNSKDPLDVPNDAVDLLLVYGMILEKYAEEALNEVCQIQNLKSSARVQRNKFNKEHCKTPNSVLMTI